MTAAFFQHAPRGRARVALRDAMGWLDYHLHAFRFPEAMSKRSIEIGIPDEESNHPAMPGWKVPESFWVKRIADPTGMSAAFGAFRCRKLVGTVALEFSAKPKTRHKALVIGMYVSPQARGSAAGRALIEASIKYAEAKEGILLLNLTVTEGNELAIRLYRSAGFEAFGTEPMAILTPGGLRAKVHMQRVIGRGSGQQPVAADDPQAARH